MSNFFTRATLRITHSLFILVVMRRLVEEQIWIGISHIGTLDFNVYSYPQNEAFKLQAIRNSFKLVLKGRTIQSELLQSLIYDFTHLNPSPSPFTLAEVNGSQNRISIIFITKAIFSDQSSIKARLAWPTNKVRKTCENTM
ncbi:uncharacterized protein N7503_006567 [Penicillium pulvis]|uniref:uncharacterized protein n=1 Tax=Penicillium pulvis TaxID=1562058 RepID=UPI002548B733|nr:uncharacterized protein N7503_006567 [Penicillium pulvis]KAJ5797271.1 hypothetical protein N7503_006567 [Penicillium pulvis]